MKSVIPHKAPERNTQAFLEVLAKGGGKPLETLSPADARAVLVGAQQGAKLPPADVSEKTIHIDGKPLKLTIVRPGAACAGVVLARHQRQLRERIV